MDSEASPWPGGTMPMLPVRWPPRSPASGRWTAAEQRRFTAWHEAGHAMCWLSYRHVPQRVELFDQPRQDSAEGRITYGRTVSPARIEPPGRWLSAESMKLQVLLHGVAAEALAGNPDPWPFAISDIEAAAQLVSREAGGRPHSTDVILSITWAGVCSDIVEPEKLGCLAYLAQALTASPRPSPSGWWLMCQRAARLLHPPDVWRTIASWPGAREAGAGLGARALAHIRARRAAVDRAKS